MTMDNNNSLRYLVNSKKGVIWVSVGDTPWKMESDVRVEPKKYFNTLRGIFYMRQNPESAVKLFNEYNKEANMFPVDDNDNEEDIGRNQLLTY